MSSATSIPKKRDLFPLTSGAQALDYDNIEMEDDAELKLPKGKGKKKGKKEKAESPFVDDKPKKKLRLSLQDELDPLEEDPADEEPNKDPDEGDEGDKEEAAAKGEAVTAGLTLAGEGICPRCKRPMDVAKNHDDLPTFACANGCRVSFPGRN